MRMHAAAGALSFWLVGRKMPRECVAVYQGATGFSQVAGVMYEEQACPCTHSICRCVHTHSPQHCSTHSLASSEHLLAGDVGCVQSQQQLRKLRGKALDLGSRVPALDAQVFALLHCTRLHTQLRKRAQPNR